jgi:hypothetical protein
MFTSEAEKLIDSLAVEGVSASLPESRWWVASLPEPAPQDQPVSAVDGGGGIQPLAGGGSIYIARAYAYTSIGEPVRGLELKYYPVREPRLLDALRSWLEHRVALSIVARAEPGHVLLMDGSLWALLTTSLSSVLKVVLGEPAGLGSIYTALVSLYTIASVVELHEHAKRKGVVVAYVSKDHSYRGLKEKVLLDYVASLWPAGRDLALAALAWYPLVGREDLLRARKHAPPPARPYIDAALDMSYRDPAFIDDAVGGVAGYSIPMTLPPPRKVAAAVLRLGARRLIDALCRRVETYASDREAAECWGSVARFASVVEKLPQIIMFYVRLNPNDILLLVEMYYEGGTSFLAPGRELLEPSESVEKVISILVRDYGGPSYYNVPLVTAHLSATLTRSQLESYVKLLESLAIARGVKLRLARRSLIARGGGLRASSTTW